MDGWMDGYIFYYLAGRGGFKLVLHVEINVKAKKLA
jgi:hypothetical protein